MKNYVTDSKRYTGKGKNFKNSTTRTRNKKQKKITERAIKIAMHLQYKKIDQDISLALSVQRINNEKNY